MSKLIVFIVLASVGFAQEKGGIGGWIDAQIDKVDPVDIAVGIIDEYHKQKISKPTDSDNWDLSNEDQNQHMNDGIDSFFAKYNTSDRADAPIDIHFQPSAPFTPHPLLQSDPSHVHLYSSLKKNKPIDFIQGGNNAATNKEMKEALESVTRGPVFRYLVGLETTSPLLASAMKQIQSWANQLNAMSIQSYELGTAAVPGMLPKTQRAALHACEHEQLSWGYDLITAKSLCQEKKTREEALKNLAEKSEHLFLGRFNVAREVFDSLDLQASNAELLLNITGSVVSKDESHIAYYPPLHRQVFSLLQNGKSIENGYRFDGNLSIKREPLKIQSFGNSEKMRSLALLEGIQSKLKNNDAKFTDEEKQLLGSTQFPVGTLLTIMTQYKGSGSMIILERYSELFAFERVMHFMEEIVKEVLYKAESLRSAQISGFELDQYIKQVREVASDLQEMKKEQARKSASEQAALDSLVKMDKELREEVKAARR
jgi:conjugative transfer pilus assembly protein TraH